MPGGVIVGDSGSLLCVPVVRVTSIVRALLPLFLDLEQNLVQYSWTPWKRSHLLTLCRCILCRVCLSSTSLILFFCKLSEQNKHTHRQSLNCSMMETHTKRDPLRPTNLYTEVTAVVFWTTESSKWYLSIAYTDTSNNSKANSHVEARSANRDGTIRTAQCCSIGHGKQLPTVTANRTGSCYFYNRKFKMQVENRPTSLC